MLSLMEAATYSEKVMDLINNFKSAFGSALSEEHLRLSIMAGIYDAYRKGYGDGLTDAKSED